MIGNLLRVIQRAGFAQNHPGRLPGGGEADDLPLAPARLLRRNRRVVFPRFGKLDQFLFLFQPEILPQFAQHPHDRYLPNRTDPSLSQVAPSSIATSKSLDMPIDRWRTGSGRIARSFNSSLSSLNRRNTGRVFSGSASWGAIVIRPSTRMFGHAAAFSAKAGKSAGARPCLVASPDTLTWRNTGTRTSSRAARFWTSSSSGRRSNE